MPAFLVKGRQSVLAHYALLCVFFAVVYCVVGACDPSAFSSPMDGWTALYFSAVTQSTVGFGDVVPRRTYARVIVVCHIALAVALIFSPPTPS